MKYTKSFNNINIIRKKFMSDPTNLFSNINEKLEYIVLLLTLGLGFFFYNNDFMIPFWILAVLTGIRSIGKLLKWILDQVMILKLMKINKELQSTVDKEKKKVANSLPQN